MSKKNDVTVSYTALVASGVLALEGDVINWERTLENLRATVEPQHEEALRWDRACREAVHATLPIGVAIATPLVVRCAGGRMLSPEDGLNPAKVAVVEGKLSEYIERGIARGEYETARGRNGGLTRLK